MSKKGILLSILIIILIIPLIIGIIHYTKALPAGISIQSKQYKMKNVQFLSDLTYEKDDETIMEHSIFNTTLHMIEDAKEFILIDVFLFNDDYDRSKGDYPAVAKQIVEALIAKKQASPLLDITVITDDINTMYGSAPSTLFAQLQEHDIHVITTNLKPLRDSNPLYSSFYRPYLQWIPSSQNGFLPNPFNPDANKASLGSYLQLANFKANHRKIVMNEKQALIASANFTHDGSALHSNIGFVVEGPIVEEIYAAEQAIAKLSNVTIPNREFHYENKSGDLTVQYVTEGKIKKALLQAINQANENDKIQIGVFYLSDRQIIKALKIAAERNVLVQLILDPNKDAFGLEKNGIPNRQVAAELMKEDNIEVRWYDTDGEQFHSKFLMVQRPQETTFIGGSANFTRRNLHDYNLESNLVVTAPTTHAFHEEVSNYFNKLWKNEGGHFTEDFKVYEDQSLLKKAIYRIQEFTGLSTF